MQCNSSMQKREHISSERAARMAGRRVQGASRESFSAHSSGSSTTFSRPVSPRSRMTEDLGMPSQEARKRMTALFALPSTGGSGNAQFQGAARPRVFLPACGLALFGVGDDFQGQFHAFSAPVSPGCLSTRSAYLIKRPPNKSRALPTVASRAPPLKASISSKSCIRLIPPA